MSLSLETMARPKQAFLWPVVGLEFILVIPQDGICPTPSAESACVRD